ncbi:deoxyribonuclease IV [Campylobacter sp. 9BO]|uniref:deoxyribonuclease IV n=1 Tax=Campylobacter sp. 9BO TaxID=3424759 RepID=UPI003D343329
MRYIGAHVSAAGGVSNAPINAKNIGANAFALFVKNQRQWSAKPPEQSEISAFKKNCETANIKPEHILPHDSYLINLGHFDTQKREQSLNAFMDEIERVKALGLRLLNFHPGSHLKEISETQCLDNIAECINIALKNSENIKLIIENTAGQGSNLGYKFEHLAYLIDKTYDKSRIGVCLDTCHMFAAGYDISTQKSYEKTMDEFDEIVGFSYLCAMHLNDAKFGVGSKKDRHESIGKGCIGVKGFECIIKDRRIGDIPLILETIDESIWGKEIELLRSFES